MDNEKFDAVPVEKTEGLVQPSSAEVAERSPEEILKEAEGEVALFTEQCARDIAEIEKQAVMYGVEVNTGEFAEFTQLSQDAESAHTELQTALSGSAENMLSEKKKKFDAFVARERAHYGSFDGISTLDAIARDKKWSVVDMERSQGYVEKYQERVNGLRADINEKRNSLITRVLEFREIRELETLLRVNERILHGSTEDLEREKELVEAYDYLEKEEKELARLVDEAYIENAKWDEEKKQEIIRENEGRDVGKLAEKHGVFFTHSINGGMESHDNKVVNTDNLDYEEMLDIVLGLEPTLSASTIHPGSAEDSFGFWKKSSVLLSGGRVIGGGSTDIYTAAIGLRERTFKESSQLTIGAIDNAIKRVSSKPDQDTGRVQYNELVIERPKVVGVCMKWNWYEDRYDKDDDMPTLEEGKTIVISEEENMSRPRQIDIKNWWKQINESMNRGLPVFIMDPQSNTVRMMHHIDVTHKSFQVTPEYTPEDVVNMPGMYNQHLSNAEKRNAAMRVFDKVSHAIPEEERIQYVPNGSENDKRNIHNIH